MRKQLYTLVGMVMIVAVGFAWTLSGEEKKPAEAADVAKSNLEVWERLSYAEGALLLEYARKAVASKLGVVKDFTPVLPPAMPHLAEKRGVFVTINKNGDLRGCIGTYAGDAPLWQQVCDTAQDSAFRDPRFPAVKASELDKLEFEISVFLCPVTKVKGHEEFVVGKHGIFIKKGPRGATFLPHVATEQKWDKDTTLRQLCQKAGLPADAWKDKETEFHLYTTQIFNEKKKEGEGGSEQKK